MPIIVKGSTFDPTPEGQYQAVCCDVVEQYGVETQYGPKNKIKFVFQTRDLIEEGPMAGKPWLVSTSMNANLSDKGRMLPFLESWRSRKFTKDELKAFDVEQVLGANAIIQVVHAESGGKTYANIQTIIKLPTGTPTIAVRDYVRVKDREDAPHPPSGSAVVGAPNRDDSFDNYPESLDGADDDLPF